MQLKHFPTLVENTQAIWIRRFTLLEELESIHMEDITPSRVTSWVENKVKVYKQVGFRNKRGKARRCNRDNELNFIKTIFNWYKDSEDFEDEAKGLVCPIKPRHKKLGFIKAKEVKNMKISLKHALEFFNSLTPFYRDFASFQYYTASRVGEVAGLQWSRIDFKNRRIVIMETARWDVKNKTFKGLNSHPKNRKPRIA